MFDGVIREEWTYYWMIGDGFRMDEMEELI